MDMDGVYEILAETHKDFRGLLALTYTEKLMKEAGLNTQWKEEYHSKTLKKFTVRGLYIQRPPYVEGKMITAVRGELRWIYLDLRKGSGTFGKWGSLILSENQCNSLYLAPGFAHGCVSVSDDCDVYIKADNLYSHSHGIGIAWNDKDLNIDWGLCGNAPLVSETHAQYPGFKEFRKQYGAIDVG